MKDNRGGRSLRRAALKARRTYRVALELETDYENK